MKRHRDLFAKVCDFNALVRAAYRAARAKRSNPAVGRFLFDLEPEVLSLQRELLEKTYRPARYHVFTIREPKVRRISAANFRDRCVQHALCAVLEPILDRAMVADTYACRRGKGTHRAARRVQHFSRRFGYFLQCDVAKYFESIDRSILKSILRRRIKDPDVLWLLDVILDCGPPSAVPGKGLPIGNLTSQLFANEYLSGLDHFVKEVLRVKGYVRYSDDMVLFSDDKASLWSLLGEIERYLADERCLRLKKEATLVAPVTKGVGFVGFSIYPGTIRVRRESFLRMRRRMGRRISDHRQGRLTDEALESSLSGFLGHLAGSDSRNARTTFFENMGLYGYGPNGARGA